MSGVRVIPDVWIPAPFVGGTADFSGALVIRDGKVADMQPGPAVKSRLVLPALVEAHCHLDKCHTVDRLADVGGDLAFAIAEQFSDKDRWTPRDVRDRSQRGLQELVTAGCGLARSHVDWGYEAEPPLAWPVLRELALDVAEQIDLTLAPLVSCDLWNDPSSAAQIARTAADAGGAIGAFFQDQPGRRGAVGAMVALADRYGLPLDFHVDEGLADGLNGLEIIADAVLETGFQGPVLCGHACSLINANGEGLARLLDKIARSGLFVAALPTTNLYLQGRRDGTPDRRGVTRLRELHHAGVKIVVGSDNVADAFCPLGQHDPMAALHLSVLAGHLDPPFDQWIPAITTHAAQALGRDPVTVMGAPVGDLRITEAQGLPDAIRGTAPLRPISEGDMQ